jgi:hypothetical protein
MYELSPYYLYKGKDMTHWNKLTDEKLLKLLNIKHERYDDYTFYTTPTNVMEQFSLVGLKVDKTKNILFFRLATVYDELIGTHYDPFQAKGMIRINKPQCQELIDILQQEASILINDSDEEAGLPNDFKLLELSDYPSYGIEPIPLSGYLKPIYLLKDTKLIDGIILLALTETQSESPLLYIRTLHIPTKTDKKFVHFFKYSVGFLPLNKQTILTFCNILK